MKTRALALGLFLAAPAFLAAGLAAHAAPDHVVTMQPAPMSFTDPRFFIAEVIDRRADKTDIGYALEGLTQEKVPFFMAGDVAENVRACLEPTLTPAANKIPLVLALDRLAICEFSGLEERHARAEVALSFYLEREGRLGLLYGTEAHLQKDGGQSQIRASHEGNLRQLLETCVIDFVQSGKLDLEPAAWEERGAVEGQIVCPAAVYTSEASLDLLRRAQRGYEYLMLGQTGDSGCFMFGFRRLEDDQGFQIGLGYSDETTGVLGVDLLFYFDPAPWLSLHVGIGFYNLEEAILWAIFTPEAEPSYELEPAFSAGLQIHGQHLMLGLGYHSISGWYLQIGFVGYLDSMGSGEPA